MVIKTAIMKVLWAWLIILPPIAAHVALTYPPARKYDLDFLDNSRTKRPCGMPRGEIRTQLLKGSTVEVTWHLAYPHQGGFRLELLDEKEEKLMDLTPVTQHSDYVEDDTTAQNFSLSLPTDLECYNCTLRLVRQAKEWGGRYLFWSCADVDILPLGSYKEDCSGHGRRVSVRCICQKRFHGDRCQFENECEDDSDCGNYGRCINTEATSYPKSQCYCTGGYFGPRCDRKSVVKSEQAVHFGLYTRKELGDKLTLFWRILKETQELEVVLVNRGISYVALGWRPQDITKQCQQFPYIQSDGITITKDVNLAKPGGHIEPGAEIEPEPEAESEPEPEAESEPKPEVESEPKPEVESEPEPEADSEPEAEAESESEPEAESESKLEAENELKAVGESRPEPEAESEYEPEAESELEPEAEREYGPEAESEHEKGTTEKPKSLADRLSSFLRPRSRRQSNTFSRERRLVIPHLRAIADTEAVQAEKEAVLLTGPSPYLPRVKNLHAMDCTDIVVGTARGNLHRILDYYTRDRSTPRFDNFWGGEDSITAAVGWEKDGETTILFRRKLNATHPTDHHIKNELMHVIWARGQEEGMYVHSPDSGLEKGTPSVAAFYKADELKYHGKIGQRGVTAINFFDEQTNLRKPTGGLDWCGGEWKYPLECSVEECEYYAKWEYFEESDDIMFTIVTNNSDHWTGIGFSSDGRMTGSDAVLGWVEGTGKPNLKDYKINSYLGPVADSNQNIRDRSATKEDGVTTLSFVRSRDTNDAVQDLKFTDEQCHYFLFPIKGGEFKNGRMRQHLLTPSSSVERICIRSCSKFDNITFTTAAPKPRLMYQVELLLTGLGDGYTVPMKGSKEAKTLYQDVKNNFVAVVHNIPGYVNSNVVSVLHAGKEKVKAKLELILDKKEHMETVDPNERPGASKPVNETMIYKLLESSISKGTVGYLQVDPKYLRVDEIKLAPLNEGDDSGPDPHQYFEEHKWEIIGGITGLLVMLALIQAIVTIRKIISKQSPPVSTKERLITNSGWKDYSHGGMNFAYEGCETEENGVNSRRQSHGNGSLMRHPQANGSSYHSTPMVPYGPGYGDTRSLQRPRNPHAMQDPRGVHSLPRHSSTSNSLPSYSTAVNENSPDFYYLPSQRKYSGEVVRVYVDYNNPK